MGALLSGDIRRFQLLGVDLLGGQAAEQVPVQRSIRRQGHVGHELHPIVGDRSDGRNELQRGAGVVTEQAGQGYQLLEGGRTGWYGPTVAIRMALSKR